MNFKKYKLNEIRFGGFMKKLIGIIGIFFLSIVILVNLVYNSYLDQYESITISNNSFLYIIGMVILGVVFILITNFLDKKLNEKNKKRFFNISLIIYIILNVLWLVTVNPLVLADQAHTCNIAQGIYNNNLEDMLSNITYAKIPLKNYIELYNQQISLAFIYSLFFRAIRFDIMEVLRIINLIGNIMTFIGLYKITNHLSKKYEVNKIRQIFFILTFFSLIMLSTFIYGDIPSIGLGLFSIYYIMKYTETKELKFIGYSAIFMMIAVMMRMNILIFVIAIVIYLWLYFFRDIKKKVLKENIISALMIFLYIIISIMPAKFIQNYYLDKYNLSKENGLPVISYILMSMSESWRGNGWYNEDIGEYALKNPKNVVNEEYKEAIKERITYFSQNIGEAFDFYVKKLASMWGENTYQAVTNNLGKSDISYPLEFYQKTMLILICIYSIGFFIKNRNNLSYEVILLLLIFMGGFSFHIIWEAKSRYILPYIVILIPLASMKLKKIK